MLAKVVTTSSCGELGSVELETESFNRRNIRCGPATTTIHCDAPSSAATCLRNVSVPVTVQLNPE